MSNFRTLLVIGENRDEIAKKYSLSVKTNVYTKYKLTEAPKLHKEYICTISEIIKALKNNPNIPNREEQIDMYDTLYDTYLKMDDFDFYKSLTEEYEHDEDGNAISTENPNAHYQYEKCYDEEIRENQENEAPFADPFVLIDGTKAYSAKVKDIDWPKVHFAKAELYKNVWEVVVDNRPPVNEDEEKVKSIMGGKDTYFNSFKTKDEYVGHCSAFWCYAVATEKEYVECHGRDIDWTNNFYDKFISNLDKDTTISIYQIKLLD